MPIYRDPKLALRRGVCRSDGQVAAPGLLWPVIAALQPTSMPGARQSGLDRHRHAQALLRRRNTLADPSTVSAYITLQHSATRWLGPG